MQENEAYLEEENIGYEIITISDDELPKELKIMIPYFKKENLFKRKPSRLENETEGLVDEYLNIHLPPADT